MTRIGYPLDDQLFLKIFYELFLFAYVKCKISNKLCSKTNLMGRKL